MDVVTVFAIVVFVAAWFGRIRTPLYDRLQRLFFNALMVMGACVGMLGLLLRWIT